ncbi:MAG: NAD(P)/FAD-dependent oxidoreductase [Armatimonadetes bacterium]|nr:NAD(P)/FAD-dependent oxidoreductase [Armatimonadota bacterium]
MHRPKVVILGGGFGGLNVAKALRHAPVDVTLIDKSNHHVFQPLLYQVATATLSPSDIAVPIRHILRKQKNCEVRLGCVSGLDLAHQKVCLDDGSFVNYDFLVIATGATHSYFGHPNWEKLARGLKSIDDATFIRGEVLAALEYAERATDVEEQRKWMRFLIVGAGPTGVELAGAFSELAHRVIEREFRHITPDMLKLVLIEAGPRVLPAFAEDLSERARQDLVRLKVDVCLNTMVKSIDPEGVDTNAGRIEGRTVIWAAGVQASPVAKWLKSEADKAGRVPVDGHLRWEGSENVYVIGDAACAMGPHGPLPGLAAVASQQGSYVGKEIAACVLGSGQTKPFSYWDKGTLAAIGRSRAIAEFGRYKLAGFLAWLAWLFIHIMLLVGFRNKVSVFLEWAYDYITWDHGPWLITLPDGSKQHPHDLKN